MLVEPALDQASLAAMLEQAYEVAIDHLAFIPTGWLAYCYVLDCRDGQRRFLKMYQGTRPAAFAASSPEFYLPLTRQLYTSGILPEIAYPLPSRSGSLLVQRGEIMLILFNFIDGRLVGLGELPEGVLAQLGRMVGILHRSTPALDLGHPLVEAFQAAFEPALLAALETLAETAEDAAPGLHGLRELLLPRRGEVLARLDTLKRLGAWAREANPPKVVCHTDLHGANLILDHQNRLHILDWENAMLAPREHDLCFLAADPCFRRVFLPAYEREAGPVALEPNLLRFYFYRRGLEDLVDYVVQIMGGGRGEAQNQADLIEAAGCLDGLAEVEATVEQIERQQILVD
ncbi:MAG TPA: phosphotransferase [Anaerolineaceae bacterium]